MNVQKYEDDEIIDTLIGPMRVGDMTKKLSEWEDWREVGCAREFWYKGQLVKRDVSIQLKTVKAEGRVGVFLRRARGFMRNLFS